MEDNNNLVLETKIKEKDMRHFLIHYTYNKKSGILFLLLSIVCLIIFPFSLSWGQTNYSLGFLLIGLTYTVFAPISLMIKAKKQIYTNSSYKKPLVYTLDNKQITISQDTNKASYNWSDVYLVEETKKVFLIYAEKRLAFIIPKDEIADLQDRLLTFLKNNDDIKKVKLLKK